jgi:uncharacterized protein (TIGR02678 family)
MSEGDPQADIERRVAARHLLMQPMTCEEHDPSTFRLIRRHEAELGRRFTQRLGYRLHLDADTARLFKSGAVIERRPLRTAAGRPLTQLEYTLLALALAANAAGPSVISLRDLVDEVRSAAAEADVTLPGDATERRALVTAMRWMIDHGLAAELHEHIDAYATDDGADAVLRVRPDRIALLLVPTTAGADTAEDLLGRAERRSATRQWMRVRLVEDPVLYREQVTDDEWTELRRRLGEEERQLDEMFGLVLEARAEGVAMIDPAGVLADRRFPSTGTLGHAALLVVERMVTEPSSTGAASYAEVTTLITELAAQHAKHWSQDYVERPDRLARAVTTLLCDVGLAVLDDTSFRLLPAAARFMPVEPVAETEDRQATFW